MRAETCFEWKKKEITYTYVLKCPSTMFPFLLIIAKANILHAWKSIFFIFKLAYADVGLFPSVSSVHIFPCSYIIFFCFRLTAPKMENNNLIDYYFSSP